MWVMIAGDRPDLAARIRSQLLRLGHDCPRSMVVEQERARSVAVNGDPAPEAIFLAGITDPAQLLSLVQQLRAVTRTPLVVIGQDLDTAQVLQLFRGGAHDYLDSGVTLEADVEAVMHRFKSEGAMPAGKGMAVGVIASRGGCGATSVAINLAGAFAHEFGRSCLLDLNLSGGDAATLLDLAPKYSLAQLCEDPQALDGVLLDQALVQHAGRIHLLSSPAMLEDAASVDPGAVERVIMLASKVFPFVVIDLEDTFHVEQVRALSACGVLVVVMTLDLVSLVRTRKILAHLERLGIEKRRVRVVVNFFEYGAPITIRQACEALGVAEIDCLPLEPRTMTKAVIAGSPAVLSAPRTKIAKAMRRLANQLMQTERERGTKMNEVVHA